MGLFVFFHKFHQTKTAMIQIRTTTTILIIILSLNSCKKKDESKDLVNELTSAPLEVQENQKSTYQAISLLGDTLRSSEPSKELLARYQEKKESYLADPKNLENIIWYGRFTAYTSNYREAIAIYTKGLELFPEESRLLRHRGHRWITLREFDKAIMDLEQAVALIKDKENMVEQDGMPNEMGIPVSTMHGNIYYHLGLAYYLKGEYEQSLEAYRQCLQTSPNPDNMVSATHWIYMNLRMLDREEEATQALSLINPTMKIIENHAYHNACLFYKGDKELREIYPDDQQNNPSNSAIKYAIGNWYYYNGMQEEAEKIFDSMVAAPDWASFGHIAAESDLSRMNFILEADSRM